MNFHKYFTEEAIKKYKLPVFGISEILRKLIMYLRQGLNTGANIKTMMRTMEILTRIIEDAPDKQLMQVTLDF